MKTLCSIPYQTCLSPQTHKGAAGIRFGIAVTFLAIMSGIATPVAAQPAPPAPTGAPLPAQPATQPIIARTLTDTQGRSLTGTILGRQGDKIRFLRDSDHKEFTLAIDTLADADRDFLSALPEGEFTAVNPQIEASSKQPLAGNQGDPPKPRALWVLENGTIDLSGPQIIDELKKQGFEVDITTIYNDNRHDGTKGWPITSEIDSSRNLPTGQSFKSEGIPKETVVIENYQILFVRRGMERGTPTQKWITTINNNNGLIFWHTVHEPDYPKEILSGEYKDRSFKDKGRTVVRNFISRKGNLVAYNTALPLTGHDIRQPWPNSYDPEITKGLMKLIGRATFYL